MSTIPSVQSYGSPFFRPAAQPERVIETAPASRGRDDIPSAQRGDLAPSEQTGSAELRSLTPPLDGSSFSSRLDGLIAGQVSSGTLTSGQAANLKTVFGASGALGSPDGSGGLQDLDGGSRPVAPAARAADADANPVERARDTGASDREAALDQFVQQLRQSVASSYSAGGAATKTARPLVFDVSA